MSYSNTQRLSIAAIVMLSSLARTAAAATPEETPSTSSGAPVGDASAAHPSATIVEPLPTAPLMDTARTGLSVVFHSFRFFGSGYIQGQYEHHDDSEPQLSADGQRLLNQDRFLVRHARVLLGAEREWAQALIELDADTVHGVRFGIRQAEATLQYPGHYGGADEPLISLTAGLFRTPFGHEIPQSSRDRIWMENSVASEAFFPGESDLGVRVRGALGWFRYALAITNGHPMDEPTYGALAPAGPNDYLGRLGFDVSSRHFRFRGGASALWGSGFHPGTPSTKDSIQIRDTTESGTLTATSLQLVPGRAATPSMTFDHWAAGIDLELNARPVSALLLSAYAEVFVGQNIDRGLYVADPISTGFDVRELGFVVGYTQLLLNTLVMGIRVDYYDPNADTVSRQGGQLVHVSKDLLTSSFIAGFQLPHSQVRILAEYDSIRDHLALGTDGATHDLQNNRFIMRLQAAF